MRISLRYKFILAFMAFTMVVTVAFGVIATQRFHSQLKVQYERHAIHLAQHAAEEVLEGQLFDVGHDPDLLAHNLLLEDVIYVQIVVDDQVKAQQSRLGIDLPLVAEANLVRVREITPVDGAAYLDVVHPLHDALKILAQFGHLITPEGQRRLQEGVRGYVRLGFSLENLEQTAQQEALLLTGLSLGLMVLGILCGWILYLMILKPIEILSNTMREFGAGNVYARAQVKSGDEIETLSHEFNTMAGSIIYQRDALRKTNEELEKANRVKSTFLAMISHELRTPMHSVLGYASLLLDEVNVKLNDAGRQYTNAIRRAGKHLMSLIENLIEFSKLESGTEQLHPTMLTVDDIVAEVVENQQPLAEKKALSLTTEIQAEVTVYADKTKLKQVLLNLVNNAVKYTQKGGVRVVVQRQEHSTYFEVCDTGPGIAAEVQASLFKPFMRAKGEESDGMGLGLTVVKRYIELMGGLLSFETGSAQGSRFWFTLPLEAPDEVADR